MRLMDARELRSALGRFPTGVSVVIARDPETHGLPISGIGGITTWRDAAEFIALGASNVQVCTAAMVYGFKIVRDLCDGLSNFMDEHGYATLDDFKGQAFAWACVILAVLVVGSCMAEMGA